MNPIDLRKKMEAERKGQRAMFIDNSNVLGRS